ncbi:hypothetical protein HKCCE2091_12000 [Rhodobacterales bacterium HKCCE2091]|nr:hypothetical protein [Rhodobacterales bacterium HKCCE2091]
MKLRTLLAGTAISTLVATGAFAQDASAPAPKPGAAQTEVRAGLTVGDFVGLDMSTPDGEDVADILFVTETDEGPTAIVQIGSNQVAIPLSAFTYEASTGVLHLNLTPSEIRSLPIYEGTDDGALPAETLMADVAPVEIPPASTEDAATGEDDS